MSRETGLKKSSFGGLPILVGMAVLGTLLRAWIARHTREWALASEFNAWHLALGEALHGELLLDQLLSYPHEWGGALLSGLALLLYPGHYGIPSLSIGALLLDLVLRTAQILLARRIFGPETGFWYAVWTVVAIPSLLNWSFVAVNFQALASVFPFLVMWLATVKLPSIARARGFLLGATLGVSLACSLSTVILLPVVLAVVWKTSSREQRFSNLVKAGGVAVAVLSPLELLGLLKYEGYAWEGYNPFWHQVVNWDPPSFGIWLYRYVLGWSHSIPGASTLPGLAGMTADTTRLSWALLLFGGAGLALRSQDRRAEILVGLGCVAAFMFAYPISRFWLGSRDFADHSAYLYYRHLPFILPVLVLIAIHGWLNLPRFWRNIAALPTLLGLLSAAALVVEKHEVHEVSFRASAWVLGRKLGHDPARLPGLLRLVPEERREEFLIGFGWGAADAALLLSYRPGQEAVPLFAEILRQYPPVQRPTILRGVDYAFEVTQGLDPAMRPLLFRELSSEVSNPRRARP